MKTQHNEYMASAQSLHWVTNPFFKILFTMTHCKCLCRLWALAVPSACPQPCHHTHGKLKIIFTLFCILRTILFGNNLLPSSWFGLYFIDLSLLLDWKTTFLSCAFGAIVPYIKFRSQLKSCVSLCVTVSHLSLILDFSPRILFWEFCMTTIE